MSTGVSQGAIHRPSPQTERADHPPVNQVSQIPTQINLHYHTSDASGHKEITIEEKAINEVCPGLLINVGSLDLSHPGFFWVGRLAFFGCKLHHFFTFRQRESNSIANSLVLMREDIHPFLKLTSLLSLYTLFTQIQHRGKKSQVKSMKGRKNLGDKRTLIRLQGSNSGEKYLKTVSWEISCSFMSKGGL